MDELEIITPNQYSLAWPFLATFCFLLAVFIIWAIIYFTRYRTERRAYQKRIQPLSAVKAGYLRVLNQIEVSYQHSAISSQQGHLELETALRSFAERTTGNEVSVLSLIELKQNPQTRPIGEFIAHIHQAAYSSQSHIELSDSIEQARQVIRSW